MSKDFNEYDFWVCAFDMLKERKLLLLKSSGHKIKVVEINALRKLLRNIIYLKYEFVKFAIISRCGNFR